MEVIRVDRADDATAVVVRSLEQALRSGASVIGVATGATFLPVYDGLLGCHARHPFAVGHLHLVLLDEYVGLPPADPRRYRHEILRLLAGPLGVPAAQVHAPDVDAPDLRVAAAAFEETLRRLGGVDLQLLGLGRNGHIGFNEPGADHRCRTRPVELTASTRHANRAAFGDGDPPHRAVTQGVGTILEARRLLLAATGAAKRDAVARLLAGPADPATPATALWRHPDATVVVDRAAAPESG